MKANTAVGIVLAGSALFLHGGRSAPKQDVVASAAALVVTALGVATLGEYVFGWRLGIDELLFRDTAQTYSVSPGRISPYSALAFASVGLALIALPSARLRPLVELLTALVIAVGVLSMLGYVWNASELVTDDVLPPVAVHTALAFTLLGIGTLAASRPRSTGLDLPPKAKTAIELKVIGGFTAAFLLLVLGGSVTYRSGADFVKSARWISHTQAVRAELDQLYAAAADAESAARAYVLTGAPRHKDDYTRVAGMLRERAPPLSHLVADNPDQSRSARRLLALVAQRLTTLEETIAAYDGQGREAAREVESTEQGAQIMGALHRQTHDMDNAEAALLVAREGRAATQRHTALLFLLITLAGAAGIFVLLFVSIRREMLARMRAEEGLRELNAGLERRVEERTAELERNERRFVDLFEFAPDALVMIDRAGTITKVNRPAEAMFGWTRSELVGKTVEALMPRGVRANHLLLRERYLQPAMPSAMRAGRPNLHGLRKDGTEFPADISLSPLHANDDLVVVAAVRDVTEGERTTEALRQSVEVYRYTLDNMLEGCQIVGFDWRYRYMNAAAIQHSRQPKEALVGRSMMEAFPGIEATDMFAKIRHCMEERIPEYCENEFVYPDDTRGWFQLSVLPVPEGVSIFSVDITERKRAEEELGAANADLERRVVERTAELVTARQAADGANRAKSAFLAAMSHEIRTPMNGVVGMVDVLAHSRLSEHQAEAVRTIRASAFALLGVIDDILDFSKIEAGRLELERSAVPLPDLIEGICDTLLPVAIDKDVRLSLFISPRVPAQVWSDPTRLRQVLFNLAGNAIKFSAGRPRQRGQVSIRVDMEGGPPLRLVMRVADNGIGMAPETLAYLFSAFTQAEVSTTRRFGGTGLGLAICKRLVALLQGDIDVQSTVGLGSTFTVTLPIDAVEGGPGRSYPELSDLDCIVVGSDVNADDLRVYLEHAGAQVHLVADLDAAAQRAASVQRPVVVIHNTRRESASPDVLRTAFSAAPNVRRLVISLGRRRRARMAGPDVVTLDGDCLRRLSLLRAVAIAAGRASPDVVHDSDLENLPDEQAAPQTIVQARAEGRLLLIAEDDEINQKVILRQIEMLGYAAEIAGNGAEALRLWRAGQYALLLTDLHMPEMDGYALAQAIRAEESDRYPTWQGRMPILALTANALRGESTRAQVAGMDEYLTKPLQLNMLKAALRKWLPREPGDTVPGDLMERPRGVSAVAAVDVAVLRGLVGDEPEIVRELLSDYRTSAASLAAELRAAHVADDLRQVGAIAHKLKSASRAVGATALGDLCVELENASRSGIRAILLQSMEHFEAALFTVDAQIADLIARGR